MDVNKYAIDIYSQIGDLKFKN